MYATIEKWGGSVFLWEDKPWYDTEDECWRGKSQLGLLYEKKWKKALNGLTFENSPMEVELTKV